LLLHVRCLLLQEVASVGVRVELDQLLLAFCPAILLIRILYELRLGSSVAVVLGGALRLVRSSLMVMMTSAVVTVRSVSLSLRY
jgi:hypothetical protein